MGGPTRRKEEALQTPSLGATLQRKVTTPGLCACPSPRSCPVTCGCILRDSRTCRLAVWVRYTFSCQVGCSKHPRQKGTRSGRVNPTRQRCCQLSLVLNTHCPEQCLTEGGAQAAPKLVKGNRKGKRKGDKGKERKEGKKARFSGPWRPRPGIVPIPRTPLPRSDSNGNTSVPEPGPWCPKEVHFNFTLTTH